MMKEKEMALCDDDAAGGVTGTKNLLQKSKSVGRMERGKVRNSIDFSSLVNPNDSQSLVQFIVHSVSC
ncbi:hypothetical protein Hanom_Chr03g00201071 [Helianthus anomalus]